VTGADSALFTDGRPHEDAHSILRTDDEQLAQPRWLCEHAAKDGLAQLRWLCARTSDHRVRPSCSRAQPTTACTVLQPIQAASSSSGSSAPATSARSVRSSCRSSLGGGVRCARRAGSVGCSPIVVHCAPIVLGVREARRSRLRQASSAPRALWCRVAGQSFELDGLVTF
jgi:hypothetical protein